MSAVFVRMIADGQDTQNRTEDPRQVGYFAGRDTGGAPPPGA
jgi:hypothetical protein